MMDNYNMSWYLQAESKRIGQEVKECRRSPFSNWLRWMGILNSKSTTDNHKKENDVQGHVRSFPPSF